MPIESTGTNGRKTGGITSAARFIEEDRYIQRVVAKFIYIYIYIYIYIKYHVNMKAAIISVRVSYIHVRVSYIYVRGTKGTA